MVEYLRISATFLDQRFHGRGDRSEPEWPPSPLRLMQALVAANADQITPGSRLVGALRWLEAQDPPLIITPRAREGAPYRLSVPNNAMDRVGKAWSKGNYFGSNDANPATHRTMKAVRPVNMVDGDTVHYLWRIRDESSASLNILTSAANGLVALGWGIDLVVGSGGRASSPDVNGLSGERWSPTSSTAPVALRTPRQGTLDDLERRHRAFIERLGPDGFAPVPPLTRFDMTGYRRPTDPLTRPCVVFELRHDDGSFCAYSQRKLVHIAGMTRHVARRAMLHSPPSGVDAQWVDRYVLGHQPDSHAPHRRFSYLPLPSIGHPHADQAVRRVMIAAPPGDGAWLEHLARRLAGERLVPEGENTFGEKGPPTLVRVYKDAVARQYTETANRWASVTPVILPGHDDRKPAKTRRLIEAALAQSGVELPCSFEWLPISRFRKSFSAHKYDQDKRPIGYIRPDHLQTQTATHLTITFDNAVEAPGPVAIGAGRHCGLGLLAHNH